MAFDVLKVRPEDIASQITLIDISLFKAITSQELLKGAWTKKSKHVDALNIVAFTNRFNSVCLWCQREILSHEKAAKRAEILGHFIRIAKHLYDLNNLNSTFSIVSALQSLSIYRLAKTWRLIGRSERGILTKLRLLFDSERNWERLREHLNSAKLPCIPYLGLYLTDLSFIDARDTVRKDCTESENISWKENDILVRILYFQKSFYDNLTYLERLQKYLQSFEIHDELAKFLEDDLFREVNVSFCFDTDLFHSENFEGRELTMSSVLTFAENKTISTHSPRLTSPSSPFVPLKTSTPSRLAAKLSPTTRLSSLGRKSNTDRLHLIDVDDDDDCEIPDYEGEVIVVIGRGWSTKSTMMKCSQKCYLELRTSHLQQFCRRSVNIRCKSNRDVYNKKASKVMELDENGWCVTCCINSTEPYFELHHSPTGRMYRYMCRNEIDAMEWCKHIRAAIQNALLRISANPITFD